MKHLLFNSGAEHTNEICRYYSNVFNNQRTTIASYLRVKSNLTRCINLEKILNLTASNICFINKWFILPLYLGGKQTTNWKQVLQIAVEHDRRGCSMHHTPPPLLWHWQPLCWQQPDKEGWASACNKIYLYRSINVLNSCECLLNNTLD